eukprot:g14056.t1
MASSAYLVQLDERRRRILAELIDHLGIASGSAEHEVALSFGLNCLSNHDHMDAEKNKVATTVCSFAERFLMQAKTSEATRLLQLASSFSGTPLRVEGHPMVGGDIRRAEGEHPPEHPFAALALTLALSGSPRWATTPTSSDDDDDDEGGTISSAAANTSEAWGVTRPPTSGAPLEGGSARVEQEDGELAGLGGDSSRLWSTDSEQEDEEEDEEVESEGRDEEEEEEEEEAAKKGGRGPAVVAVDTDERDTQEWLRAFESDGERSPRTDDEGYATDGSEVAQRRDRWGETGDESRPGAAPAPVVVSYSRAATAAVRRFIGTPAVRHKYGTPCIGADIRSLGSGKSDRHLRVGESDVVPARAFLRPCQTLEACQTLGERAAARRRSIPEAEVVREALHMLQGLSGDIFVRVDNKASPEDHYRSHQNHPGPWMKDDGSGGREKSRRRASGINGSTESGRTSVLPSTREWFSLSASAARDLAVASLSPEALAGLLGELVRLGSVAEYLRAFVADARTSASVAAAAACRGGVGNNYGGGGASDCAHGHTTQAFVACVRRQMEAFEDAVERRDRDFYLRQTARGSGGGGGSLGIKAPRRGETLVGLLSLLRPEAESLEVTKNLVEAGAGWWVNNPPGGPAGQGSQRRQGGGSADASAGRRGSRGAGLRERTGRLLAVLHDALVSSELVGTALPSQGGAGDGARAPLAQRRRRRHGWLLRVFCAVLTPYLRLLDSWITEGRIFDPHGELFLSQSSGGGGSSNMGIPARGSSSGSSDPVVHVWDTGIVLHSKALPPFFAPLASAVALAGQDISLMRRVRALVAGSSSLSSLSCGSSSGCYHLRREGLGGTGLVVTTSPESEAFSLADTLVESLRHLAVRVQGANKAGLARKLREEGGGGPDDGIVDPYDATADEIDRAQDPLDLDAAVGKPDPADLGDDDDQGRKEEDDSFFTTETNGNEGVVPPISAFMGAAARKAPKLEPQAAHGDEPGGELTATEALFELEPNGNDADRSGGGGPAAQPGTTVVEESSVVGVERSADGGRGALAAPTDEKEADPPLELGFFEGTARMALEPGVMLRRALHPALAAPWLPPPPQLQPSPLPTPTSPPPIFPGQRTAPSFVAGTTGGGAASGGSVCETEPARAGVVGVDVSDDAGGDEAAIEEDVARALPLAMVLETCLLGPLRDHCRLASSSCLGAFADELGIVGLAGVLREIYLSPGGAKSVTPLSRFRGTLFSLLGALLRHSRAGDGVGSKPAAVVLDGVVVRDVPSFLQDGPRLTALLQSSLAMSGSEGGGGGFGRGDRGGGDRAGDRDSGAWLRSPVVGGDRPLLEHFFVECIPETVREWRGGAGGGESVGVVVGGGGGVSAAAEAKAAAGAFPLASDGRCVDLQLFSCLQLECRLPWPISVALPPRSLDKYSRVLGLLLKLEFTTHILEEAHVLHSHSQRDLPRSEGALDRRHEQQCRLYAFLRVARAVRSYAVTQALVKPWAAFEARVPMCDSLRGFIRLHQAYLDLILERCFLLPRSRQTLAYLLDALQAGISFAQRYGEYIVQLGNTVGPPGGASRKNSSPGGGDGGGGGGGGGGAEGDKYKEDEDEQHTSRRGEEKGGRAGIEEACRASLRKLDDLWEHLGSSLGFVIPLLKELVRSRSGVHVNELLCELDFNGYFERQKAWRTETRRNTNNIFY